VTRSAGLPSLAREPSMPSCPFGRGRPPAAVRSSHACLHHRPGPTGPTGPARPPGAPARPRVLRATSGAPRDLGCSARPRVLRATSGAPRDLGCSARPRVLRRDLGCSARPRLRNRVPQGDLDRAIEAAGNGLGCATVPQQRPGSRRCAEPGGGDCGAGGCRGCRVSARAERGPSRPACPSVSADAGGGSGPRRGAELNAAPDGDRPCAPAPAPPRHSFALCACSGAIWARRKSYVCPFHVTLTARRSRAHPVPAISVDT
jgi:hypothetical protein